MAEEASATYDGKGIYDRLCATTRDYARWDVFFARNGIEPTVLVYEELVANPQATIDQIAKLFGLQESANVVRRHITLEIQRDEMTEEWKQRFINEYLNRDVLDAI